MNKFLTALLLPALLSCAQASDVRHRFICVDNQKGQLVHVNQFDPSTSWKVPSPKGSRDVFVMDSDHALVSRSNGGEIISLKDGASLQRFTGLKGVCSASRTPQGTFLFGSPAGFAEMDASGTLLRTIVSKGSVNHLRLCRMLENGHIVYCAAYEIFEIDEAGTVVWSHKSEGKTYLGLVQENGDVLSTRGAEAEVVRVSRDGNETLVGGGFGAHADASLAWFSGFDALANGHVVVANWRGHGFKQPSQHVFEFDTENRIVWSWDDASVKGVTTVQVIR